MFPDNLSIHELAKEHQSLKAELNMLKSSKSVNDVTKAALQLRADIKKRVVSQAWPPETDKSCIPNSVLQFSYTLQSGDATLRDCLIPLGKTLTNGKQKPLKHILLPFSVKSLMGNVELIHTLNRFGHSVSYSQLE